MLYISTHPRLQLCYSVNTQTGFNLEFVEQAIEVGSCKQPLVSSLHRQDQACRYSCLFDSVITLSSVWEHPVSYLVTHFCFQYTIKYY